MSRPKILTVALNYFPGYMSGGVARTVLNTTQWLGDEFEFLILTRDRDLNASTPYADIEPGAWQPMGASRVRYLAPHELTFTHLAALLNTTEHDAVHLNSYFDPVFTIRILLLRRLRRIGRRPVLLSPRGEFGAGSLCIKYPKKKVYLEVARRSGLYSGVSWHASSGYEADEMAAVLRIPRPSIEVAIDLPVRGTAQPRSAPARGDGAALRIVFLSRVSREKNLDGALRILRQVQRGVLFDMIGPLEDAVYWQECRNLMRELPPNVRAAHRGSIAPDQVLDTLAQYDLLLFPSHGENYGHAIAESIAVGTRVLVSRCTPWRNLQRDGLGWDLDLNDHAPFARIIDRLADESPAERTGARERARVAARARLSDPAALIANRSLFSRLTARSP